MNFIIEIVVQNGQVVAVRFPAPEQPVALGAALQALDAAKAALLNVQIAQPAGPEVQS